MIVQSARSEMIRREETSLRRIFRRLLFVSLAAPIPIVADACGSSPAHDASHSDDGGSDAFEGTDATSDATSSPDARPTDDAVSPPMDDGAPALDSATETGALDAGMDSAAACAPTMPYVTDASYVINDAGSADAADEASSPFLLCYSFVDLPCGLPAGETTSGCFLYLNECSKLWTGDGGFYDCQTWGAACVDASVVDPAGAPITLAFDRCSAVGRRPAGLAPARATRTKGRTRELGNYFARAAHLEAASVAAFVSLRRELVAFGAPRSLARMAARSARDEVRHARAVGRLARRFGGEPARARMARPRRRSLEEMACENAVEGCVRETFGAMVATWQATHAKDAEIRAAMRPIAEDETRHAALAWAIARWAAAQLDDAARARVRAAREDAVRALSRDVAKWSVDSVVTEAGLPAPAHAQALVASLRKALWES
jgi:hypothetical protein